MGHSGILFADWQKSRPIFFRVISSGSKTENVGRALEWHSRGQRFDPAYLHQSNKIRTFFQLEKGSDLFITWINQILSNEQGMLTLQSQHPLFLLLRYV